MVYRPYPRRLEVAFGEVKRCVNGSNEIALHMYVS